MRFDPILIYMYILTMIADLQENRFDADAITLSIYFPMFSPYFYYYFYSHMPSIKFLLLLIIQHIGLQSLLHTVLHI